MQVAVFDTKEEMGRQAAADGAAIIREAIAKRGDANIILATGASQFEMLAALAAEPIDFGCVSCFHLDEYVNLPMAHPASCARRHQSISSAYM